MSSGMHVILRPQLQHSSVSLPSLSMTATYASASPFDISAALCRTSLSAALTAEGILFADLRSLKIIIRHFDIENSTDPDM